MAKKAPLAQRRAARKKYEQAKKAPLGSGKRFAAVEASAKAGGADNPGAVAASAARKKYGNKKVAQLAAKGRSRKSKKRS
jgi:hypothetical protein